MDRKIRRRQRRLQRRLADWECSEKDLTLEQFVDKFTKECSPMVKHCRPKHKRKDFLR